MNTFSKRLALGLLLTIVTVVMIDAAIRSCSLKKPLPPETKIQNEIKKNADSVATASGQQPDSSKLRKLAALKLRIAKARFDDSLQRLPNQRR